MRETTLQTPRLVKEREEALEPLVQTMVRQAVSLQPREVHGGAHIHV